MANPLYSTKVLGYGAKTSNVVKAAGVLKGVGNVLGVLGVGVGVYQVTTGQISKTEFLVDTIMTGVGVFGGPFETAASLIYFGGKGLYEFTTGDKLFGSP
ncbi:hypothetical protein [Empedobacter brevis]|uniref:hypothetical protein n=1 Tax=Empedobacter brevis TaxID=247 RepID=UPI00289F7DAD|nr:hypothetical protein [Empedobacter brevis]